MIYLHIALALPAGIALGWLATGVLDNITARWRAAPAHPAPASAAVLEPGEHVLRPDSAPKETP